jgi:penicillin amidase
MLMGRKHLTFCFIVLFCVSFVMSSADLVSAQPQTAKALVNTTTLRLSGLKAKVGVSRDERGIPYIEAENEEDLYFAQGYIIAGDRLWQMDLLRRTSRGELSEVLGSAVLDEDKRHRAFSFAAIAEQMLANLSPPVRASLEAYSRGVNAFIESLNDQNMPLEFRILQYKPQAWNASDSLVIGKLLAETLSTSWQIDLMRASLANLPQAQRDVLLPVSSPLDLIIVGSDKVTNNSSVPNQPTKLQPSRASEVEMVRTISEIADSMRRSLERVGLYAEDCAASNNWVVSGKHTQTGKPLLANDPHLAPSAPSIWYMAHLGAPGLRVAGVTLAGVPGIVIGHNARIAWGITNVESDAQDLYIEKFDPANPRRYMTPNGWRESEVRHDIIKVRKSLIKPETETVGFDVTITRHGPIILEKNGVHYALAWSALDPKSIELEFSYLMNRARNWRDFRTALSRYSGFGLNFVYADVDGHIGYWGAGRYPIRKTGNGTVPYDGSTNEGDWMGYVPFEATPHVYDPPSGIIVTANNRIVGSDYPYYITQNWFAPYRARRIHDLLTAKKKLTVEDFRRIQGDTYSIPDATFTAEVIKIARPLAQHSDEWREMIKNFEGWDSMMSAESAVMPIANLMRAAFQRFILAHTLGIERARNYAWANSGTFFDYIITTRPRAWLPKGFDSYEALLLACYKEARQTLTKDLGPDTSHWTWGNLFQVRFRHPLANAPLIGAQFIVAPVPQNGGTPTVNRGGSVSMRLIVDTNDWDNTRQGIAMGESGDPKNKHWRD